MTNEGATGAEDKKTLIIMSHGACRDRRAWLRSAWGREKESPVPSERNLVEGLFETLLAESRAAGIPDDVIGRLVIDQVVSLWRESRSLADITSELSFLAENVDPDADFEFMRP